MGKLQIYDKAIKIAKGILQDRENLDMPHFRALIGYNLNIIDYKTLLTLTNAMESLYVIEVIDGVVRKKEVQK
jgi:hypothetical protein